MTEYEMQTLKDIASVLASYSRDLYRMVEEAPVSGPTYVPMGDDWVPFGGEIDPIYADIEEWAEDMADMAAKIEKEI